MTFTVRWNKTNFENFHVIQSVDPNNHQTIRTVNHRLRLLEMTVRARFSPPFPFFSPFLPSFPLPFTPPVLPVLPLPPLPPVISPVSYPSPSYSPYPYPLNPARGLGERCKFLQRPLLVHFQAEINAPFSVS